MYAAQSDIVLSYAIASLGMFTDCVYHVHSKGASDDTAQQKNTDYVRDKERRQQAARLKKLVYGSAFSGIPILRQLDVTAPSYWLSSAALVRWVVLAYFLTAMVIR
jgi:hypothetical protein